MTKKRGLLIVGLVLLVAAGGVVYTLWQQSLSLDVDIATGTIDPVWSLDGTDDDGIDDPWLDGEETPGQLEWPDKVGFGDPSEPADGQTAPLRYTKDVALCVAAFGGTEQDPDPTVLNVDITNAYPSYWCTVKADLHNGGSVPVKLQTITVTSTLGEVIETEITSFEGLLSCGLQLDPGQTEDFYLSFHPENPVLEGTEYSYNVDLTWVNYNEYDSELCQEPGGPTVTPGAPTWTRGGGVRIKGYNTGAEIFIGPMTDSSALPRTQVEYNDFQTVGAKTYQVTFSHDGSGSIATSITSPSASATWASDAYGCLPADWDAMEIFVRDSRTDSGVALQNVMLQSFALGNFGTVDKAGTPGGSNWTVTGFDFSQNFTVTADLVVDGYNGNESIKVEFNVGCLP